jgi:hypothetical protein
MKITLPQGFELPEGAKPGQPFEVVATLELNEDGSAELEALDGIPVESETEETAEMEPEEEAPAIKLPWEEAR